MIAKEHAAQGAHGGDILTMAKRFGCAPSDLIDMSSNLSPFGMVPGLQDALLARFSEIGFLPESNSETLCEIFAEKYGVQREQVLAGNGTTEFIYALPAGLACTRAVSIEPTYSDYRRASDWAGLEVEIFPLLPEDGFRLDFERLAKELQGGELVFLCNPNNPTSGMSSSAAIHEFICAHPDSYFLVDESYLPFVREPSLVRFDLPDNAFILRSASKIYGIAGMRLGFLVATEKNMQVLAQKRKPWGVNRLAQLAGEFLLQHGDDYVEQVVSFLEETRPKVVAELSSIPGVEVMPGSANFILCRLSDNITAEQLREEMLSQRIMVRNCSNFMTLDESYFRISLKNAEQNEVCLAALKKAIGALTCE